VHGSRVVEGGSQIESGDEGGAEGGMASGKLEPTRRGQSLGNSTSPMCFSANQKYIILL
jgi:hypothetical protein